MFFVTRRFRRLGPTLVVGICLVLLNACGGAPGREPGAAVSPETSPEPATSVTQTEHKVQIFLQSGNPDDCSEVVGVNRAVSGSALLKGSIEKLLEGATSEEKSKGYGGWFSSKTAGMLNEVTLNDEVARIDFHDLSKVIPNASTSCGSATLLAQLDSTAEQFSTVKRAIYSIEGDAGKFYSWLQLDTPG